MHHTEYTNFYSNPPPKPENPEEKNVIDKLAEFVAQHGSSFEEQVKQKERNNPKFAFLFQGGSNSLYYQWKLQQITSNNQQPITLNIQETQELNRILEELNGSKDSIRLGKEWVMEHLQHSQAIVQACLVACERAPEKTKKLHILYLCNDVLYSVLKSRAESGKLDIFSQSIMPNLETMLRSIYIDAPSDIQEKVTKTITLWKARTVFPEDFLNHLEQIIKSPKPTTQVPYSKQPPNTHQQQSFVPASDYIPQNAPPSLYFPQTISPPQTPPNNLSQTSKSIITPAPPEPIPSFESIFNYLKLRHHNPYQLLNASAVNSFNGQFNVSENQLRDDITLFYDHLNAFERVLILGEFESRGRDRPEGKETKRPRSKSPTRKPRNKSPTRSLGIDLESGMREDGSSIYGPAGRMGLGASSEENLDDPFSAYRMKKSSNYRVRVEERLKYGPEATAQKCYKCGKAGHIARECKA